MAASLRILQMYFARSGLGRDHNMDAGPALPVIKVAMNGKKITVSGALRSGGITVVSTVTGEPAGVPTFIRLDPGVTVAQLLRAARGDPNNVALIASIVFSPQATRGTSSAQANLAPGRYVALDATSRTPPLTTFTIAKASSPATLPEPQATVSSIEFGFRGPGTLRNSVHNAAGRRRRDLAGCAVTPQRYRMGLFSGGTHCIGRPELHLSHGRTVVPVGQ